MLDLSKLEHKTYWIIFFLQSLCNSEDLVTQLTFLQNLDEEKRDLLQGTILRHEMLIAYLHLYHKLEFHSGGGDWTEKPRTSQLISGEHMCYPEAAVILHFYYK